jgi:hypothetical protein
MLLLFISETSKWLSAPAAGRQWSDLFFFLFCGLCWPGMVVESEV